MPTFKELLCVLGIWLCLFFGAAAFVIFVATPIITWMLRHSSFAK